MLNRLIIVCTSQYQHLLTAARNYLMCICSLWPSSRTRRLHVLIEAWFYQDLSIVHLFYRARRSEGKYTIRKQVIYIISIKLLTPFLNYQFSWGMVLLYTFIDKATFCLSPFFLNEQMNLNIYKTSLSCELCMNYLL